MRRYLHTQRRSHTLSLPHWANKLTPEKILGPGQYRFLLAIDREWNSQLIHSEVFNEPETDEITTYEQHVKTQPVGVGRTKWQRP